MSKGKGECPPAGSRLKGTHEERTLPGAHVRDVDARGASLERWCLEGALWTRGRLDGAQVQGLQAAQSSWVALRAEESRWQGCDLRRARFLRCNFEGSVLESVQLEGAELTGSSFRGAWLGGLSLEGVQAEGADFRDVGGLDEATLDSLRAAGARTGRSPMTRGVEALLRGDNCLALHQRRRRAGATLWATLGLLVPLLFFGRAILNPVHPDSPPGLEEQEGQAEEFLPQEQAPQEQAPQEQAPQDTE